MFLYIYANTKTQTIKHIQIKSKPDTTHSTTKHTHKDISNKHNISSTQSNNMYDNTIIHYTHFDTTTKFIIIRVHFKQKSSTTNTNIGVKNTSDKQNKSTIIIPNKTTTTHTRQTNITNHKQRNNTMPNTKHTNTHISTKHTTTQHAKRQPPNTTKQINQTHDTTHKHK